MYCLWHRKKVTVNLASKRFMSPLQTKRGNYLARIEQNGRWPCLSGKWGIVFVRGFTWQSTLLPRYSCLLGRRRECTILQRLSRTAVGHVYHVKEVGVLFGSAVCVHHVGKCAHCWRHDCIVLIVDKTIPKRVEHFGRTHLVITWSLPSPFITWSACLLVITSSDRDETWSALSPPLDSKMRVIFLHYSVRNKCVWYFYIIQSVTLVTHWKPIHPPSM